MSTFKLINGHSAEVLKTLADNSIDSIVTDPPYLIGFLGKQWDHADNKQLDVYEQCYRVLKPGGHILAFSAARTYHHLAVTLEQAGFEIRDQIMWIYSSGFPKSQDVGRMIQRNIGVEELQQNPNHRTNKNAESLYESGHLKKEIKGDVVCTDPIAKQWAGWGTALKPAHEPICLARKPMKLSIAKNVQQWGTGALNIDATRVGDEPMILRHLKKDDGKAFTHHGDGKKNWDSYEDVGTVEGRFPSNVLGEIPDYQKYFYCPKVSRKERHMGFDTANIPQIGSTHPDDIKKHPLWDPSIGGDAARLKQKIIDAGQYSGNNHPTVKPVALMEYLIKLITPPGGTVLDPFNGSGSTGMAAVGLGYNYIGIDLDENYINISRKRIEAWLKQDEPQVNPQFAKLFE